MLGTRIILGGNSSPLAYRVSGHVVEYALATDSGWSPKRSLALDQGMAVEDAIALVENLVR
jgi:hypothetical protein